MRRCGEDELGRVRVLLGPGEQPVFGSMVSPLTGAVSLGPVDNRISFDPLLGFEFPTVERWIDERIGGSPVSGFPGCLAHRMHESLGVSDRLVLSTHRVLIVSSDGFIGDRLPRVNWFCPLSQVVHMKPTPRLLRRGWLSVYFVDRSRATLSTAWFSGHLSRRFSQELTALRNRV